MTISEKLEAARQDLLDLSLRNYLLNYHPLKSKGLEVVDELSPEILRILVSEEKAMSFLPRADEANADSPSDLFGDEPDWIFEQPDEDQEEGLAARHTDTKLQTPYTSADLQRRLRNTFTASRTAIEEQGVNILFLTLGMLNWYESESSEIARRAPLVLVPVELYRTNVHSRFRVRYTGEDLGDNLSFRAKIKTEFGVDFPEFEWEDVNLDSYFSQISQTVSRLNRWSVDKNGIALGFFSFAKFLMYKDLEAASWSQESPPHEHPIIAALLEDRFDEPEPRFEDPAQLDTDLDPSEVYQVVDADSSQSLAILDVKQGRNLVLQGPPGTGKSQTITNLIAESVAAQRTVLFVAEKMAALEVVKRRLDQVGLGAACLEIHSQKANKRAVLDELKRTLDLGRPLTQKKEDELASLTSSRARLNAYCDAVNTPVGRTALTPFQAYGSLADLQEQLKDMDTPVTDPGVFADWDRAKYRSNREIVEELERLISRMGSPRTHLFWGCRKQVVLPTEQTPISEALGKAIEGFSARAPAVVELADQIGTACPHDAGSLDQLLQAASLLLQAPVRQNLAWTDESWIEKKEEVRKALRAAKFLKHLHSEFDPILIPEAWDQNVLSLRQPIKAYGTKWWRFVSSGYRRARQKLEGLCQGPLAKDGASQLAIVESILEQQRQRPIYDSGCGLVNRLVGEAPLRETNWSELLSVMEWMERLHVLLDDETSFAALKFLESRFDADKLQTSVQAVRSSSDGLRSALDNVLHLLDLDERRRFPSGKMWLEPFSAQREILQEWAESLDCLHDLAAFNRGVAKLHDAGLDEVAGIAESWPHAGEKLTAILDRAWFTAILDQAVQEREPLADFDGESHQRVVERFRQLDKQILLHNRAVLAAQHWDKLPRYSAGGKLGVLQREFEKKKRHYPIRKLIELAGNVIQTIKPVFMMSPLSIAKFVPSDSIAFDLVVFDEASQVEPVDAFGALLRSRQAVVVGDSKQLPPTRFFQRITEGEDAPEEATSDLESILGMFRAQGAPQRWLRWHYRSRHESLIAVSNEEFYDNKLVVFPSPDCGKKEVGLVFRNLPDTFYESGASRRRNILEAREVAKAVLGHARRAPDMTLGVAAFSQSQAQAIEDQLEILRRKDPSLEPFFASHPEEPFFVKNLENVQGDERDVILISVGYGKQQGGYMTMSFGPLNWDGGERRLNVLITRARCRCEVYANFTADDIDLRRTQARGVVALKRYLKYAETGIQDVPIASMAESESPFEAHVESEVSKLGYEVHRQVGTGGFFIDLAVLDMDRPGRYLLGIECDGATYHRTKSARDRDRLREQVLRGLGWKIHRIWSTDWFRRKEREIQKLVESIESARANPSSALGTTRSTTGHHIEREEITPDAEISGQPYTLAEPSVHLGWQELHEVSANVMAGWVQQVVEHESPVHEEEVARRITNSAGLKRVGSRILSAVKRGVRAAEMSGRIRVEGEFLWTPEMSAPEVRDRSAVPAPSRKIAFVAPEEIQRALLQAVERSFGMEPDEAVSGAGRLLGFFRIGPEISNSINQVLDWMIEQRKLKRDGSFVQVGQSDGDGVSD